MGGSIFQYWRSADSRSWGKRPVVTRHNLATSPLFELNTLAGLIDDYPRESCDLVQTSAAGSQTTLWLQGELGELTGREIIEWIEAGRVWLNLRRVQDVDPRYAEILAKIFAELDEKIPGLDASNTTMGILISSPGTNVPYHVDLPAKSLWQVRGGKRFILYPAGEPYVSRADLESIALNGGEFDLTYDPAFDADAVVMNLHPGTMVHWPLHAPHRVENLDILNVSVTIEHWTKDVRRRQMVNAGNAILRNHLGLTPRHNEIRGIGFLAKAAIQAVWRRSPMAKRYRRRTPAAFRLDRSRLGAIADMHPAEQ